MGIDAADSAFGQFVRKAGANDRRPIQAQNGVHHGCGVKMGHQLLRDVLRFTQSCLLVGDINIIIDMAGKTTGL